MDVVQSELLFITAMLKGIADRIGASSFSDVEVGAEIHRLAERLRCATALLNWRPASTPPSLPFGWDEHDGISIPALVVVHDARICDIGDPPFIDIAAYWPARKRWTLTCATVAGHERFFDDYLIDVLLWQPLPAMTWGH